MIGMCTVSAVGLGEGAHVLLCKHMNYCTYEYTGE